MSFRRDKAFCSLVAQRGAIVNKKDGLPLTRLVEQILALVHPRCRLFIVVHELLNGPDKERPGSSIDIFIPRRALTALLTDLLGVQRIICDTRTELSHANFVTWAGKILAKRSYSLPMV